MKQVIQSLKNGKSEVAKLPVPSINKNQILIRSSTSLISSGTERMLLEFGKSNFINKALQQPDKVKLVLQKIKTDGLQATIESVSSKLDRPIPLGYSNVGTIVNKDSSIGEFKIGDRVISNGYHAEFITTAPNLCAKVPDNVSNEEASFTVIGSIALHGIRLVNPSIGEYVGVIGLGLVGLLSVQILRANGCKVLGLDFNKDRLKIANMFGAEVVDLNQVKDPTGFANKFSNSQGLDAVIISAATSSNDPVSQAAAMCRKRGRIVLVGVTGLNLSRDDFYEKELSFQVSCSYGPGRYDPVYEKKGLDYPIAYVRWTEQRNFESVLSLMSEGKINLKPLITHEYKIDDALSAYETLFSNNKALGILLKYSSKDNDEFRNVISLSSSEEPIKENLSNHLNNNRISFIGAGNHAGTALIPLFSKQKVIFQSLGSNTGINSIYLGRKFKFQEATTDINYIFNEVHSSSIVISTRHDSHADLVMKGILANKNIFVEKPLCLTIDELNDIKDCLRKSNYKKSLMVGFNRRFAPHIQKIKSLIEHRKLPISMVMKVNAGKIPADHWIHDKNIGGGRIIGEACHFIDLLSYLADSKIDSYSTCALDDQASDTLSISLTFANGSIGTIHYFSNGSKSFPKETLDIFCDGGILKMDNYRSLIGFDWPNFKKLNFWNQKKGHKECIECFLNSIKGEANSIIDIDSIFHSTEVSIKISEAHTARNNFS